MIELIARPTGRITVRVDGQDRGSVHWDAAIETWVSEGPTGDELGTNATRVAAIDRVTAHPTGARIAPRHVWIGQKVTVIMGDDTTVTGHVLAFGRQVMRLRDEGGKFVELHRFQIRSIHEA